jgi:hypothetical protein
LSGKFHKKILLDDSFWTLEDNKEVVFTLMKGNEMEWWKCVIEGEPEIDTTKVNPENSKLGDLDGTSPHLPISLSSGTVLCIVYQMRLAKLWRR